MLGTVWESQVGSPAGPLAGDENGRASQQTRQHWLLGYDSDLICPPRHMPGARLTLLAFQRDQKETQPPACKPDYAQPSPVPSTPSPDTVGT